MRKFDPDKYKKYVEEWDDPVIRHHEEDEIKLIKNIRSLKERTVVDLGAGYGRVIPYLYSCVNNLVAIEINKSMFEGLEGTVSKFKNTKIINGDITKLSTILLKCDLVDPVFVILENTLGTIEGDHKKVLREIKTNVNKYKGEVVISLYRQRALKDWGIMTYWHGKEMNGEPNLEKTDFDKGIFVSKTGYTSKWWTDDEIEDIKKYFGGRLLGEIVEDQYWIMNIARD